MQAAGCGAYSNTAALVDVYGRRAYVAHEVLEVMLSGDEPAGTCDALTGIKDVGSSARSAQTSRSGEFSEYQGGAA